MHSPCVYILFEHYAEEFSCPVKSCGHTSRIESSLAHLILGQQDSTLTPLEPCIATDIYEKSMLNKYVCLYIILWDEMFIAKAMTWMVWVGIPVGLRDFLTTYKPNRICGIPSLMFKLYRVTFPGIKRLEPEGNPSTPSNIESKKERCYTSVPRMCPHAVERDNFTFIFCSMFSSQVRLCSTELNSVCAFAAVLI
jgi:hypothetical protein